MKILQEETKIIGSLIFNGKEVVGDDNYKRIEWLKTNYLKKITADESGWCVLYQDPEDNRYWELTYPESDSHGGGAPLLTNLSMKDLKTKYGL